MQPTPLPFKIDKEHMKRISEGFLFGFDLSDLFILASAILAVVILQFGDRLVPFLDSITYRQPQSSITGPSTQTPPHPSISESSPGAQPTTRLFPSEKETTTSGQWEVPVAERILCPQARPRFCTMECLEPPPYICGSDAKQYCTVCQACSNEEVDWYVIQNQPCPLTSLETNPQG